MEPSGSALAAPTYVLSPRDSSSEQFLARAKIDAALLLLASMGFVLARRLSWHCSMGNMLKRILARAKFGVMPCCSLRARQFGCLLLVNRMPARILARAKINSVQVPLIHHTPNGLGASQYLIGLVSVVV